MNYPLHSSYKRQQPNTQYQYPPSCGCMQQPQQEKDDDLLQGCHWYDPLCGTCVAACAATKEAAAIACDTAGEIPQAAYAAAAAACIAAAGIDHDLIDDCKKTFCDGCDPISLCNKPVNAAYKSCKKGCYKV